MLRLNLLVSLYLCKTRGSNVTKHKTIGVVLFRLSLSYFIIIVAKLHTSQFNKLKKSLYLLMLIILNVMIEKKCLHIISICIKKTYF